MPIKHGIYRYLKKHGRSPLHKIAEGINQPSEDVKKVLEDEVIRGYLNKTIDGTEPWYWIRIILGPLTSKEKIVPLWKHDVILQGVEAVEPPRKIPESLLTAMLEAIFWWQGGRGTCVGFAGALYRWYLYMLGTGIIPTIEELKAYCNLIEEDIGCTAGKFKYLTMHPDIDSPQWIYDRSRKYGNCTYPAGSDTTWAAKVIALEGSVKWNDCLTSISGMCAPELWIGHNSTYAEALAKLAPLAAGHKNKFAATNNFNEVFNAIKAGKSVFGPVNLPPDFLNPPNGEWLPYGGSSAGGHAIFVCRVDEVNRKIASRGSWDGDDGMKWYWMGERFFDDNAGPFLIGLTQEETKYGESIYTSCNITSNVPATISVNGVNLGISPQKIALEKGKTYLINASADGYISQQKTVDDSVTEVSFTLEAVVIPQPVRSWLDILRDMWKSLIALFRR